jgi:hypothetical protein
MTPVRDWRTGQHALALNTAMFALYDDRMT